MQTVNTAAYYIYNKYHRTSVGKKRNTWSVFVDYFCDNCGITEQEIITALRGQDLKQYYSGQSQWRVFLVCRAKLFRMWKDSGNIQCYEYALANSNLRTLKSLVKHNYFDVAEIVNQLILD